MIKKEYTASVKLLSAMHINGGTDAFGKRKCMVMDNKAYIPASLFKGMVRENFSKLWLLTYGADDKKCIGRDNAEQACDCMVCKMFGKAGFQRSRIYFDHLETEQEILISTYTGISVSRHSRTNVDGSLVFTEVVERNERKQSASDKEIPLVFSGDITVYYPLDTDELTNKRIEAVLTESIRSISYIGLGKSRGLGFVETNIHPKGEWLCAK